MLESVDLTEVRISTENYRQLEKVVAHSFRFRSPDEYVAFLLDAVLEHTSEFKDRKKGERRA